jgi:predicted metal-dependent TIM-barrel fold hydrolase
MGAFVAFSFFVLTHATQVALTHVDEEKHKGASSSSIQDYVAGIRAAGGRAILSSDSDVYLLPPPVEALREYVLLAQSQGFSDDEIRRMVRDNSAELFGIVLHRTLPQSAHC